MTSRMASARLAAEMSISWTRNVSAPAVPSLSGVTESDTGNATPSARTCSVSAFQPPSGDDAACASESVMPPDSDSAVTAGSDVASRSASDRPSIVPSLLFTWSQPPRASMMPMPTSAWSSAVRTQATLSRTTFDSRSTVAATERASRLTPVTTAASSTTSPTRRTSAAVRPERPARLRAPAASP